MKATIFLEYYALPDASKEMDGYYESSDDYVAALKRAYDEGTEVMRAIRSGQFEENDRRTASFTAVGVDIGQGDDKENLKLCQCPCRLFDIDMNDETVDDLITKYVSREMFCINVKFDGAIADEIFEEELKQWCSDTDKVWNVENMTDEWKIAHSPRRTVRISFLNNAGEKVNGEFLDCFVGDYNLKEALYSIVVKEFNLTD